ncbi:MAG: hypothetical protein ACJAVF_003078 [Paraglaciecola sp.]|jgi:hypothetical protein
MGLQTVTLLQMIDLEMTDKILPMSNSFSDVLKVAAKN